MRMLHKILVTAVMASLSTAIYADDDRHEHLTAFQKVKGELSVMVLGSGGPIATAEGRASAGYLIFTDGKPRILMDVGGGTYQRLAQSGTNISDLDTILLSHLHADHTGDLTPVMKTLYFHVVSSGKARKMTNPVNIYGPGASTLQKDNTGKVTYPNGMLVYPATADYVDEHYSVAKGGVERYLTAFVGGISGTTSDFAYTATDLNSTVPGASEEIVLSAGDGLVIKSIAVDHGPVPAVAFRIEYKGHSIVYSGDTGSKGIGPNHLGMANMTTISQGADVLIYDTAIMEVGDAPPNPLFHLLHTQPSLIAGVAKTAGVKTLVLSHLTPVTSPRVNEVKAIIEGAGFTGKIKEAKDLKVYNLSDDD